MRLTLQPQQEDVIEGEQQQQSSGAHGQTPVLIEQVLQ